MDINPKAYAKAEKAFIGAEDEALDVAIRTYLSALPTAKPGNEQSYFDALKRIAAYTPPERMKRDERSGKGYGLDPHEAVEMAYENVIEEAKRAVRGKRRPPL